MSYRFVIEDGELRAVPADPNVKPPTVSRLYVPGTHVLFPKISESVTSIAVAVA